MSAVNNLLDKYRETCLIASDSALADSLRIRRQAIHQWRKGLAWPSEDHVIEMAKAIKEPAEKWFVTISAERASPAGKKVWLRLAQAAKAAAAIVALVVSVKHGFDAHAVTAVVFAPCTHYAQLGRPVLHRACFASYALFGSC